MNGKQRNFKKDANGKNRTPKSKKEAAEIKGKDFEGKEGSRIGFNDPSWYDYNPELTRNAANFPYPTILGVNVPGSSNVTLGTTTWDYNESYTAAGVMAMSWIPTIGVAKDISAPVNVAAQQQYAFIRKSNSGYANYEASDLLSVEYAMDSIYILIAYLKRLYGMARLYNITNRYVPVSWFQACGVPIDDVQSNLANFRTKLEVLIAKAAVVSVPDMPLYHRHEMMCEAVYTDVDSFAKSQTYIFVPEAIWSYDHLTGKLTLKPVKGKNVDELFALGDTLVDSILLNEDVSVITGDIRKAYEESQMHKISFMPDDYVVPVIYDKGIQSQIENMRWYTLPMNLVYTNPRWTIQPEVTEGMNGWLKFNPDVYLESNADNAQWVASCADGILNMHWSDPTPLDTMYATRMISTVKCDVSGSLTDGLFKGEFESTGSEIFVQVKIYTSPHDAEGTVLEQWKAVAEEDALQNYQALHQTLVLTAFDWHPIQYIGAVTTPNSLDASQWRLVGTNCDLDNFTVIPAANIKLMNDVALLSLLRVPARGVYNG